MMVRIEPSSPRRAMIWVLFSATVFALTGCASVETLADQGWTQTRKTAAKVMDTLRPAPLDAALFTHEGTSAKSDAMAFASPNHDSGDAALNTPRLEHALWLAELRAPAPLARREAVNRTLDNGVTVYRPSRGRSVVTTSPAPRAPVTRTQAPQTASPSDPFAYVRMGRPSNGADWQACEGQVGGAFIVGPKGVRIADDFDRCMRARGYLPEAEAEGRLELAGGIPAGLRGTSRP